MTKDDTPLYTPSRDHLRLSYTAYETRRNVRVGDHQSLDELEGEFELAIRRIQAEALRDFAGVVEEIASLGANNTGLRTPEHLAQYTRNYADRIAEGART